MRANSRRRRASSRKRTFSAIPARSIADAERHGDFVLVASGDDETGRVLCDDLNNHGFRTILAGSATPVDELATEVSPLLILLDLDRSDDQGLALLARLHEQATTPVIVLSERASEGDKVIALDAGAEDYVTKPFGRLELFARIRVALRYVRTRSRVDETLEAGPIRIDRARYLVTVRGTPIHLTPIEFRLLSALARWRGTVVTRGQLAREVWGPDTDQTEHVRVHIAALRRKLEHDPRHPRWLVTVTGVGYRLRD